MRKRKKWNEDTRVKIPATIQFMRLGYFCLDSEENKQGKLVFNRTVELKDSWGKKQAK